MLAEDEGHGGCGIYQYEQQGQYSGFWRGHEGPFENKRDVLMLRCGESIWKRTWTERRSKQERVRQRVNNGLRRDRPHPGPYSPARGTI